MKKKLARSQKKSINFHYGFVEVDNKRYFIGDEFTNKILSLVLLSISLVSWGYYIDHPTLTYFLIMYSSLVLSIRCILCVINMITIGIYYADNYLYKLHNGIVYRTSLSNIPKRLRSSVTTSIKGQLSLLSQDQFNDKYVKEFRMFKL